MTARLPIVEVVAGERHRRDLGELADLEASIAAVGLLHPVVVTPDHRLVAGERRLEACRRLGWSEVPVTVVDTLVEAADELCAELEENACRRALTPTEAEGIHRARAELLRPLVDKAKAHGQTAPGKNASGKLPEAIGEARETAAVGTGYSATSLRKVREVRTLAESPGTPAPVREAAQDALARMDIEGKVDGAYREFRSKKRTLERVEVADAAERIGSTPLGRVVFDPRPGSWWQVGEHLLHCGDSTSDEFRAAAQEHRAMFAFADPPGRVGARLPRLARIVAVTPGLDRAVLRGDRDALPVVARRAYHEWDRGAQRSRLRKLGLRRAVLAQQCAPQRAGREGYLARPDRGTGRRDDSPVAQTAAAAVVAAHGVHRAG